jgi:hypothetical protein
MAEIKAEAKIRSINRRRSTIRTKVKLQAEAT